VVKHGGRIEILAPMYVGLRWSKDADRKERLN
jgi:hypothetical protein